ncbi:glutathione S-transferase family protein [Rhizorhabdus dicambivorans]|uniref:Glutathione S-transferase n=1 Tax=Rhizorhabdus dicambivorans TaxID=1850238 RepID=A0A2A4G0W2_9SPHN|nr:glutathione S-transferase [Rhizorhabdus dicambivorans]ATE63416.1 glutathione S-transferase [Rhizorhabdus dicambivorans]PCE43633.1 glutathione S-transferase [Rhizorhabdus dicambivorans]
MSLIIWGRLNSHNVKKVAWAAVEAGIDHERRDIGGKFGFTDAYLAMNPNRLIPTIEDDGFVLWESNAILRYLAAKYAPALWPDDLRARALADRWMDWQTSYAPAQFNAFWGIVRTAPADRDLAAIAASAATCGEKMAILDAALAEKPWLSGDSFRIGDIPMGVYAHTWFTLDIERPARPHVEAWYERLKARPGYADNVMIPLT